MIIFAVLETAKANGLIPETYLLSVLPERFTGDPQIPVDDLLPWIEEMQSVFGCSGVEH
ncbi:MAG: transposase domain-containing protein [Clostridia bacterium]|nr:transposase domain-containing protein [Clostridia bacterium]